MTTNDKSAEPRQVSCEVCLKEIPISEATVAEATDYFVHFCGLHCYEHWKKQAGKAKEQLEKPGP